MAAVPTGSGHDDSRRRLLARRLAGLATVGPAIPRRAASAAEAPLSPQQLRLWRLHRRDPSDSALVAARAFLLEGRLRGSLAAALAAVVGRHETLRTRYVLRGDGPVQAIDPAAAPDLEIRDAAAHPPRADALADRVSTWARRSFDLAREHPIRALLLRLGAERHVLAIAVHRICADARGLDRLVEDLRLAWEATASGAAPDTGTLPALPVRYADYAAWRVDDRREAVADAGDDAGLDPPIAGDPPDGPRAGVSSSRPLAPALLADLRASARARHTVLAVPLLAAFGARLCRTGGTEEAIVGLVRHTRERAELDPLVGAFAQTIPIRIRHAAGEPFERLVDRLATCVPLRLAGMPSPEEPVAGPATPPLRAVLDVRPPAAPWPSRRDLRVTPLDLGPGATEHDLELRVVPGAEAWRITSMSRRGLPSAFRSNALADGLQATLRAGACGAGRDADGL
ncbi:condensation domain-containing protein [Salinarimonas chemoclinalis]|uniref:condensation domain-containing protein n=1 Tax=Salinarimonas chemoclinalis TaxID=3241599 RepID=UPI003557F196